MHQIKIILKLVIKKNSYKIVDALLKVISIVYKIKILKNRITV